MTISRARLLFLTLTTAFSCPLAAQYPGVQSTVERQIQTLEQKKAYSASDTAKADAKMKESDFASAFALYKSAVDILPRGGSEVDAHRQVALDGFSASAYKLAEQRVSQARYEDALAALDAVLDPLYNPNYAPAISLRRQLLDPKGFPDRGTMTPQHIERIGKVKNLLREAQGFFDSARYDLAFKRCEQSLDVDNHNIAARRLMEKINQARQEYAKAGYNNSRASALDQVSSAWAMPIRKFNSAASSIVMQPEISERRSQSLENKLDSIKITRMELNDTPISEALDYIEKKARELDDSESDPANKGINIVRKFAQNYDAALYPITLALDDVPLRTVIEYVTSAANLKFKVEDFALVVVDKSEITDFLTTKKYKVPASFIQNAPGAGSGVVLEGVADGSQPSLAARSLAAEYLESQGIPFKDIKGASAFFNKASSTLTVTNTLTNLELVDAIVDANQEEPPSQIEIEAKFLEITQNNLHELGFDWLLGQVSLPAGSGFRVGGGTQGNANTIDNDAFPTLNAAGTRPIGAESGTSGPITAGNRSGSFATTVNAIDALLLGSPLGPAAGVLSVAGVFTNPEFQIVIRALNQKKGVDLITSPRVTTQSSRAAKIRITREFRYPKSFEAPEMQSSANYTPALPAAPSEWEMTETGIILDVTPTVGPDKRTIDMTIHPRIVEFDGFINYGSPIYTTVAATENGIFGGIPGVRQHPSLTFVATENVINQPVFSRREIETAASVNDGQTIVLGGMMREDVQKIEDKVPFLGDLPLAGRLFRSSVEEHTKRNMIIFVTATLLDFAGQPVTPYEEFEESVSESTSQPLVMDSSPSDVLPAP